MSGRLDAVMQIYAVAHRCARLAREPLTDAVAAAAAAAPELETGDTTHARSRSGAVEVAAVSHPARAAGSRRYRARAGEALLLYDGLPVAADGSFAAHDARRLLEHWEHGPERVTGLFSAIRVDLAADRAECLTDALGISQVFEYRRGRAWMVSNSVEVIRRHLGLTEADELGLGSLLAIGWVMGGRTLLADVRELQGGHVHRLEATATTSTAYLSTTTLARARRAIRGPNSAGELAERLRLQTGAISAACGPVRCGVTAGRDTRVLVAMLRAAGAAADYYTIGSEGSRDVTVAREVVAAVGGDHRRVEPQLPDDASSWREETARYVVQTDGMAVMSSIGDWRAHRATNGSLGTRLWGMAGEIGRGGVGIGTPMAAAVPGLRRSFELQRRLVLKRLGSHGAIVRPAALAVSTRYLDDFLAARRAEGWPVGEVAQAFYAFERIGQWSASGLRRTAAGADQYSPFLTRDFIEYAISMSPAERYQEAAHHRLLSELSPALRDLPFERAWRRQAPRAGAALALAEAAGRTATRTRRRIRGSRPPTAAPALEPPSHYGHRWIDRGAAECAELAALHAGSPVWEVADRSRVRALLQGPPHERWPHLEGLGRTMSALWFLHGPRH